MAPTITRITIPKSKLATIPDVERNLYFMLGHIANELSCLRRLLIIATNYKWPDPIRASIHVSQAMLLAKMLGGKCREAWRFIEQIVLSSKIGRDYQEHLSKDGDYALMALKKHFGKGTPLYDLRDEFAFHYLTENWTERLNHGLSKMGESEVDLFDGGNRVNTHWHASEVVVNYAMLHAIDPNSVSDAGDKLMDEVTDVSDLLFSYCEEMMWSIAKRYLGESRGVEVKEELSFPDAPSMHETIIPVIVSDTEESEARRAASGAEPNRPK